MHIHNLARLVIVSEGHILLTKAKLKNGSDYYFLPGGHIEYHETIKEASVRELKEELDIDAGRVSKISLIGVYEHSWDNNGSPYHEIAFICTCQVSGLTSTVPVKSNESHISFQWQPLAQLGTVNFLPVDFRTLLPRWLGKPVQEGEFFTSNFLTKTIEA